MAKLGIVIMLFWWVTNMSTTYTCYYCEVITIDCQVTHAGIKI